MFGQRQPSTVTLFRSHGHNNALQSEKVSLVEVETIAQDASNYFLGASCRLVMKNVMGFKW